MLIEPGLSRVIKVDRSSFMGSLLGLLEKFTLDQRFVAPSEINFETEPRFDIIVKHPSLTDFSQNTRHESGFADTLCSLRSR